MQVNLSVTKISYIRTLFKVQFIQEAVVAVIIW